MNTEKKSAEKNVEFIKNPGFMNDLFFLFILYFNKDFFERQADDKKEFNQYYDEVMKNFSAIPDSLRLFFQLKEQSSFFMNFYYFIPFKNEWLTTYNLQTVIHELHNIEQVKKNLLYYFFQEIDERTVEICCNSMSAAGELFDNSDYDNEIKLALYRFFSRPRIAISELVAQLRTKKDQLEYYYMEQVQSILNFKYSLDINDVTKQLKACKEVSIRIDQFKSLYVTTCLISRNIIRMDFTEPKALLFLGINYQVVLKRLQSENLIPDLESFGNALADSNRVRILRFIAAHGDTMMHDLEHEFQLSSTMLYYHVTLLIKGHLLQSRNQGRKVIYRLNQKYLGAIIDTLTKYHLWQTESDPFPEVLGI